MVQQSIIGHILLTAPKDILKVKPDYFTDYNRTIIDAMVQLEESGKPLDFSHLANVGIEPEYLFKCLDADVAYVSQEHFTTLKENYETRMVKDIASKVIMSSKLSAVKVAQDILNVAQIDESYCDHIDAVIDSFMTDILKPKAKEFDYYKYDSSLNFLNIVMGSLRKSELNLVGARSGVGKTLFVMQNLSHWSESLKTLFISREMRSESLWKRILVRETGIDNTVFRDKTFTQEQLESIYRVNSMFKGRKLYLNSKISTISEIRRKLYEMNAQLLVVDYLQIMDAEGNHGSREREVAWLSRQLKKIATEFDIPVVVLTQLNDNSSENRPTGERDVRESKAPYQDSDNVIYLHKPTTSEVKQWIDKGIIDDETLEKFDLMEVNVVKQRDGEVKNTLCRHIKSQLRFTEIKPLRSAK